MAMMVEIIQTEIIKPSSPTPLDQKVLNLSALDQLIPAAYVPLVLFYPKCVGQDQYATAIERSQLLKTSLSESLTHFYPLAGRFKDNAFIECEDEGVVFIEARIRCPLSEFSRQLKASLSETMTDHFYPLAGRLKHNVFIGCEDQGAEYIEARDEYLLSEFLVKPDVELLKQLLPAAIESTEAATGSQLLVQANFFDCGGLAIGVCVSHKLADAETLTTFIKCWSGTALKSSDVVTPVFMGASIFPQLEFSFSIPSSVGLMQTTECVMKRFVFDASKICKLKAKATSERVPEPTRVEVVSALIWRCAMNAASRSNQGSPRKSVFSLSVNLRKWLAPPLPENYAGNCVGSVKAHAEDPELELQALVGLIRKEKQEFGDNYAKKLQGDGASLAICGFAKEFGEFAMRDDIDFYNCTSWCKFALYDADFGWGKPSWLSIASITFKNVVVLIDTSDGAGIEAWLTLNEEEMALFEANEELLEFAAASPGLSVTKI